jgi:hypothetical protein
MMAATGWKRPFADPIPLPRGRQLVTLNDAGDLRRHQTSCWRPVDDWIRSRRMCRRIKNLARLARLALLVASVQKTAVLVV